MSRPKKQIDQSSYDKFQCELEMYNSYLHNVANSITEDDKDDKDKQRIKRIIEAIDTLNDDDRNLIIILYLHYNKKLKVMYNEFHLSKVIQFNSLCNNVSKIKNYIKEYVDANC